MATQQQIVSSSLYLECSLEMMVKHAGLAGDMKFRYTGPEHG